jgi:hypothetical protein
MGSDEFKTPKRKMKKKESSWGTPGFANLVIMGSTSSKKEGLSDSKSPSSLEEVSRLVIRPYLFRRDLSYSEGSEYLVEAMMGERKRMRES